MHSKRYALISSFTKYKLRRRLNVRITASTAPRKNVDPRFLLDFFALGCIDLEGDFDRFESCHLVIDYILGLTVH